MQLPMNRHPDVAVYNITAFYLGIIKAYGYSIDGLVYNHYLIPSYWAEILNYYKAYYVKKHCFRCKKIELMPETAVEVMKAALDQNCYLMLMVNERYIPDREVYGCFDRNHDIMVYGYDDEKQVFHTASFIFRNSQRNFDLQEVSYQDFARAIDVPPSSLRKGEMNFASLFLQHRAQEPVRMGKIRKQVRHCLRLSKSKRQGCFVQMGELIKSGNYTEIDVNSFYFVKERANLLMKLFQALCPGDKIVEEYAEVCELAQRLMMLAVKENIRSSPANKERMFHYLVKIEELERDVLKKFLHMSWKLRPKGPILVEQHIKQD